MGKRKHSFADSDAKRTKNPFILDDVEEMDEDYESDEGESLADSVEVTVKRTKKTKGLAKRKSGAGEKVSKELAAAMKETERREKDREARRRQLDIWRNMSQEEMIAWAKDHYGDMTGSDEDDTEEGDGLESDDDDSSDYDDMNWAGDMRDRGFNLWMVRCGKRKERVNVRKIKRHIRQLKKHKTSLPIGRFFFHTPITGLFWVEAKNRRDLLESLHTCQVPCSENNVKMVPMDEVNATFSPRPRPDKQVIKIVEFQVGMSVSIIKGEHLGREGMVVDMGEDTVTVIFTPDIQGHVISRNYVKVQEE